MRISVQGASDLAKTLRGLLEQYDYVVTDSRPHYTVFIEVHEGTLTEVDGIDCELERLIVYHMEKQGIPEFLLRRAEGVRSETAIRLRIPVDQSDKAELGILHGILNATKRDGRNRPAEVPATVAGKPVRSFWQRFWGGNE